MKRQVEIEKATGATPFPVPRVGADEADLLCVEVEALLKAWHLPGLDRVTWSETQQDLVLSGVQRASHGKGVRAISHASFNLGLMSFCVNRSLPHPGITVLDSPLVVYRQPDEGEHEFAPDVKDAFFRSVAAKFSDLQVIVFENESPPMDILKNANLIEFTGAGTGRRGFLL